MHLKASEIGKKKKNTHETTSSQHPTPHFHVNI